MHVHNFLENSVVRFPDKVAVIHDDFSATYGQINTHADRMATFLNRRGIEKGDRVILLLENSIEYIVAYYGILKAGAVAVPLSTDLKPNGFNPLLIELEPSAIISSFRFERLLQASDLTIPTLKTLIIHNPKLDWSDKFKNVFPFQEILVQKGLHRNKIPTQDQGGVDFQTTGIQKYVEDLECGSNADIEMEAVSVSSSDLANIIYTSGSTGKPKGVMLTHGNIVANVDSICQCLQLTKNDIQMVVLPFFYVMGKSLLNTIFAVGGTLVLNNKFAFPATVVNQMIEEKVTIFSGVPSTYAYLLHRSPLKKNRNQLSYLRMVTQAGGHMARSIKTALGETLPAHTRICIMYGATEASARLTWLNPDWLERKIDSIGQPIPGVTLRILDENGSEVHRGEKGEIVVSGPNITEGYWRDPGATKKVLDDYGYYTGDIGWQDHDGFVFLEGRRDNLLKVGGHRINPREVEDALMATETAIEAAVFGVADDLLGNKLMALAVPLNSNITRETMMEKCAALLPKYKLPAEITFVRSLPKSANGKVDRRKSYAYFNKDLK